MRDRTLPMKWVSCMAESGKTDDEIRDEFIRRGIKESTISDQFKRLRKHAQPEGKESTEVCAEMSDCSKPFRPVPKDSLKKKK